MVTLLLGCALYVSVVLLILAAVHRHEVQIHRDEKAWRHDYDKRQGLLSKEERR